MISDKLDSFINHKKILIIKKNSFEKWVGSNSYIVKLHEKVLPPLPFRTRKSLKKGCSVVVVATAEEVMLATVEVAGFTTPLPKH